MKKEFATVGLLTICASWLITACGAPATSTMTTASTKQTTDAAPQAPASTTVPTNTTSSNQPQQSGVNLSAFRGMSQVGIQVQVPAGWTKSSVTGGDYSGFKFTNPNHSSQSVLVIHSTCVGCYLDPSGKPNPQKVIPKNDEHVSATQQTAYAIRYQFQQSSNQNSGNGILITSKDKAGYAYVETLIPKSDSAMANQVLASFAYTQ